MMKYTSELKKLKVGELRAKCTELGLLSNGTRKEMAAALAEKLKLVPRVQTEDTGLILEMGICLALGIDYVGEFKYSMEKATALARKLEGPLREWIAEPLTHTAHGKGKYDFTGETLRLSAKSNKTHHMVAPQTIGQPTKKRFCEAFGLSQDSDNQTLKQHILDNVEGMLPQYFGHTFDCSVLYYHQREGSMKLIESNAKAPIDWSSQTISFSKPTAADWNESNSIRVEVEPGVAKTIGNLQFHNNRDCIKFRWDIRNLVEAFPASFTVRTLCTNLE